MTRNEYVTHRSTIMTATRVSTICASNRRPPRPPWVSLPLRPHIVIVAAMVEPDELQELCADETSILTSSGGGPFFARTVRIAVPDTVTAITVTCDDHLIVGTVRGTVGVVFWNERQQVWHEFRQIMDAGLVPSVLSAISVTDTGFILAGDERGGVAKSFLGVDGRNQIIEGNGIRIIALDAVARGNEWVACVSNAKGVVRLFDEKRMRDIANVPKFGNARVIRWNGDRNVNVGGDDSVIHSIQVDRTEGKVKIRRSGSDFQDDGHVSYVTAVCVRGNRVLSAGMDGRVVLWRDDHGQVVYEREGEAIYAMEWIEDNIIYISCSVDEKGKCMLYRINLGDAMLIK